MPDEPEYVPAKHMVQGEEEPVAAEYLPGAQMSQRVDPAVNEYSPATQEAQTSSDEP